MLKEIHLAGSVRTPFGSFCGAFADVSAAELGKAAAERSGVKPEDVKELLSILLALTEAIFRRIPWEAWQTSLSCSPPALTSPRARA